MIFRLALSPWSEFGGDQVAIYKQALNFYHSGSLSPTGARIVYSNTALPGSLQDLLTGIPLFLSNGLPWGTSLFVALVNFVSSLLVFVWLKRLFPNLDQVTMSLFVMFAPWTYLFTSIWNPSYLPLFGILFLFGLTYLFEKQRVFLGSFLITFTPIASLQLHLSGVLVFAVLGLAIVLRCIRSISIGGLLCGMGLSFLPLIPYFRASSVPGDSKFAFILSNIQISDEWITLPVRIFFRFLSFSTGETTRLIGKGKGFGGAWEYVYGTGYLIPFFVLGLVLSVALIAFGTRIYVSKSSYRCFGLDLVRESPKIVFERLSLLFPWLTALMFVFSIKGPSAQTYWVFLPLSFFVIVWAWNRWFQKRNFRWTVVLLATSSGIYSTHGMIGNDFASIQGAQTAAKNLVARDASEDELSRVGEGVRLIVEQLKRNQSK